MTRGYQRVTDAALIRPILADDYSITARTGGHPVTDASVLWEALQTRRGIGPGLCTDSENPDAWFADVRDPLTRKAIRVCARCPITKECRDFALAYVGGDQPLEGVWGGLTMRDRQKTPRKRGRPPTAAEHGTRTLYARGCRCYRCKQANTASSAERRAQKRLSNQGSEENPQPNKANRPNERNSMSEASVWDDPDIRSGGEYVKLEKVGDSVSGTITGIRTHRFDDGKVVPQILLATDDGEERTLTAGQVRLKAELSERRPEAGDHLKVTVSEIEKRSGGKTLKHFDVEIVPGGSHNLAASSPTVTKSVAPSTAAEPAPSTAIDAKAAAAALANLSQEQRTALGL